MPIHRPAALRSQWGHARPQSAGTKTRLRDRADGISKLAISETLEQSSPRPVCPAGIVDTAFIGATQWFIFISMPRLEGSKFRPIGANVSRNSEREGTSPKRNLRGATMTEEGSLLINQTGAHGFFDLSKITCS
jgi:hypothetical protein